MNWLLVDDGGGGGGEWTVDGRWRSEWMMEG